MPEIKSTRNKVLGPLDYTGYADPNLASSGVPSERIGSRDTWLSGSYDKHFDPIRSQNQQRFDNQTWYNWLGNNAWSLGKGTATNIVKGVGGVTSLIASPFVVASGYDFLDSFEYNPINMAANGLKAALDSTLPSPTFVADGFNDKSFTESLSDPGQLLSQNIESVAFLTSAIASGGFLSKLGAGSKIVSKFASANKLDDVLEGAKALDLTSKARKIDHLLSHSFLSTAEAAQEGEDLRKTLVSKLTNERIQGKNNYSDEEIKSIANDKGTNVFWQNLAALSVTNLPFTKLYGKVFSKVSPNASDLALKLGKEGFEAQKLTGIRRLMKGKEFLPTAFSALATNVVAESLEESLQHTIQHINTSSKHSLSLIDSTKELLSAKSAVETTLGMYTDKERAKAAGLGGLIGGVSVVAQMPSMYKEAKDYKERQASVSKELNEKFDTVLSSSVYKKKADKQASTEVVDNPDGSRTYTFNDGTNTENIDLDTFNSLKDQYNLSDKGGKFTVKGEYELDENNNPIVDENRVSELQASARFHAELDDMMDNVTMYGKNNVAPTLVRSEKLTELARLAFDNNAGDLLIERFETALEDKNSLEKYGADESTLRADIKALKDLKNIYENVNKDLLSTSSEEDRLNRVRKHRMFQLGARAQVIGRLANESYKESNRLISEAKSKISKEFDTDTLDAYIDAAVSIKSDKDKISLLLTDPELTEAQRQEYVTSLSEKIEKDSEKLNNFSEIEKALRKTELESLIDESLKYRELNTARNEIDEVYDAYLTTKDLSKIAKLEDRALKTRSELAPKSITLDDKLNVNMFKEYLSRRAEKLVKRSKRNFVQKEFIKNWINYFVNGINIDTRDAESTLKTADVFVDALRSLMDSSYKILPETVDLITEKLGEFLNEVNEQGEIVEDGEGGEVALISLVVEKLTPVMNVDSLVEERTPILAEEDSITAAIEELSATAQTVVNDFTDNPDEYDDLGSVVSEVTKMKNLVRLLNEMGVDSSKESELFETLEKTVLPKVEENVINKDLKNIAQSKVYGESFNHILNSPGMENLLKDIIDISGLKELFKADPYTAYLALIQAVKTVKTVSEVEALLIPLEESLIKDSEELKEESSELLLRNPIKFISYVIDSFPPSEAINIYKEDYDIVNFMKNAAGDKSLEDLVNLMLRATALLDTRISLHSDIDSLEVITRIKKFVEENQKGGSPAPSIAQERVITQLTHFMSSPSMGDLPHDDIAALKSPPGAGKTLIIIPTLMKVLGIAKEEVISSASQALAAENLSKAVGTAKGLSSAELVAALDSDSIDPKTKLIVFDEAAADSTDNLYNLAKAFTRYRRRNPDAKIKMIYLYDPNQGTGRADGLSALDTHAFHKPTEAYKEKADKGEETGIGGEFYYSYRIYDVIPLPVSYRSDVPQILSLQNRFLSKVAVPDALEASASSEVSSTTSNIQGTFVGDSSTMLKVITKSLSENPTRTRAIIVLNESDKAKYASTGVLVLTTKESAGLTFDEAYVDAPKLLSTNTDEIRAYNQRVYTALSRARDFVYLAGFDGVNTIDTTIPEKVKINSAFKVSRHKESIEQKDEQIKTINTLLKNPAASSSPAASVNPTTDVEVLDKEEDIPSEDEKFEDIDLEEILDENSSDAISIPIASTNNSVKGKIHTNNEVLKELQRQGINKVKIIKEVKDGVVVGYRIVAPASSSSAYSYYVYDVAVMDEGTFNALANSIGIDINNVPTVDLGNKSGDTVQFSKSDGVKIASSTDIEIDPRSHTIKFYYDPTKTEKFKDTPKGLNEILNRFLTSLEEGGMVISNKQEILSNPDNFVQAMYFTSAKQKKDIFPDEASNVPTGKPLLVIRGMKSVSGNLIRPMFIELQTPVLNPSSKEFERYGGPSLMTLAKTLKKFDEKLQSLGLDDVYKNYAKLRPGEALIGSNGSPYYIYHSFIIALSEAYINNDKGNLTIGRDTVNQAFNKLNPDIALPPIPIEKIKSLLKLANEIDILVHGDRRNEDGSMRKRGNHGPAQAAMDRISSANMIVELPNMTTKILRSTRVRVGKDENRGKQESYAGGLTLLGPITYAIDEGKSAGRNSKIGMSYNPLFPQSVVAALQGKLQANPESKWLNSPAIKALLNGDSLAATSFSLEDFESLFSTKGFKNANSGFGVRAPLYIPLFQSGTIPVSEMNFDGVVETNFSKVYPTNLGLVHNGKSTFKETVPTVTIESSTTADIKADIRDAVQAGEKVDTSNVSEKERKKFERESGVTIDEAVDNYEKNTIAEFIKKPNFISLMKTVFSLNTSSLKDLLTNIFEASPKALGSKVEKAPRDFIASFAIAHLLGITKTHDYSRGVKSSNVLSMVERYYSSTKKDEKTTANFNKAFFKELELLGATELEDRAKDLEEAANSIASKLGIEFTMPKIDSPLDFIRALVLLSSKYRAANKEVVETESVMGDAVAIQISPLQKLLNSLQNESPIVIIEKLKSSEEVKNDPRTTDIIKYMERQISLDEDISSGELIDNINQLYPKLFSSKAEFEDTNLVSEEEGQRIYDKLFNPIGVGFIKRIFRSRGEGFRIVDANRLISEYGEKVWGIYKDGVVYVASKGKVGSKVVLHESFHHVFNTYLTKGEKAKLYELAKNKYGDLSNLDLEESLADDFMNYAKKEKSFSGTLQSFFRKLLRFFNFTYHNLNSIEDFFESTLDGNFQPRKAPSPITRYMEIERFFGDSKTFELAKKTVLDRFEEIETYDGEGKILAFDEILGEVFKSLRDEIASGDIEPTIAEALKPLFEGVQGVKQFVNYFFGNSPAIKSIQDANAQAKEEWIKELEELEDPNRKRTINPDEYDSEEAYQDALEEDDIDNQHRKDVLKRLISADISAETLDHELVDPETKITGIVKQRLLSIKYKHRGQEVRADFSKVYNVVLNILASSDNSSMEALMESIKERTKAILTIKSRSEVPKNVRVAAALFIESQLDKYSYLEANRPKNIVFRKDINHEGEYVIYSTTGVDVSNLTYTTAKNMKGVEIKFYTPGKNYFTYDGFAKTLGISYTQVESAFKFYEQSNLIKSLVGAVTSLRRASPSVGVKEYKEGVFTSKYINNREAGAKAVVETDIINGYIRLFTKAVKANSKFVFSDSIVSSLQGKIDPENMFSVAQSILLQFGIKGFRKDHASEAEIAEFIDKAKIVIEKINVIGEESPFDIISDESSFIESAVALISTSGNLIQNSSYIRGDGKRAYLWVDSSLQTSIFTATTNSLKGYRGMVNNYFSVGKGGLLSSKSEFLKKNVFFNGTSKIHNTVEHDSIKWKGRDSNAVDLYSETSSEAISRTFDLGFLGKLASKNTYIQFLPIPSNRRTISGVEVDYLNKAQVRKALRDIILAQKTRPNPKTNERLSNNDNYIKNWDKFNLPGIDGESTSMDVDQALEKVLKAIGEDRVNEYLMKLKEHLSKEGKEGKARNYQIDFKNLSLVYKKLSGKPMESLDIFNKNLKKLSNALEENKEVNISGVFTGVPTKEFIDEFINKRNEYLDKVLKEVIQEYYLNSLVNSYSLSQMLYGDESFFKSKEDLTKRIQVFTATGDVPLIDKNDGFPPTSRIGVLTDVDIDLGELEELKDDSFRETSVEGDGQGYMLPEAYERLAQARGKYAEDDVTLKTVYASVDENGVPTLLKYAVIVLTDAFIGYDANGKPLNQKMHNLREAMRNPKDGKGPLDQAVFESAVKTGSPSKKNLADPFNPEFGKDSIIEIDNRHFRFQLNPASDVDKTVANLSQITAMIDTNGMNPQEAYEVHNRNSMLFDVGMRLVARQLGISRKGKLSAASEKVLRKRLISSNEGMVGKEALVTMLSATRGEKRDKKYSISLDLPIIGNQLISSLASVISSATVGFRFPGSKLVLQSEYGTYKGDDYRLKYKDKDGFTEVLMPEAFREFFTEGDIISNDAMVGFRIPSTNYHSAVALKVKGFYKVPAGSAGNIVITPSAMSYFQGSDFDVDSLFIIKKQRIKESFDLSTLLAKYNIYSDLNFKEGDIIGADTEIQRIDGNPLSKFLYLSFLKVDRALEEARNNGDSNLQEIEEDMKAIAVYFDMAAKNEIVHTISSNLRDIRNRRDLLTPISFARVSKTKDQIRKSFVESLNELKEDLIKSELLTSKEFDEKLEDLKKNGIDILKKEEMSPLAQKLFNKYSTEKEDSVIEMYARLEAKKRGIDPTNLSTKQVLELVNPKGTTHDPLTQLQIHSNTYAGVSLTGIAANTAKTLAYVFNAGRIISVKKGNREISFLDSEGNYQVSLVSTFLREEGFNSMNQLINSDWSISKREDPALKFGFKLGTTVFDTLSRFEKDVHGNIKKAFEFGKDFINIFETIDSITNLAIDNVKEQKLFVLGITNSNSNAFMSGIALGIPLNELSKIFRSPAVAKASMKSSFSASAHKDKLLKELEELSREELLDLVKDYAPEKLGDFTSKLEDSVKRALSLLSIELEYLDASYLGKSNLIGDYILMKEISKLEELGAELFDYAVLFSMLRSLPSDKASLDSVVESAMKYQEIASEEKMKVGEEEIASKLSQVEKDVIAEKLAAIKESEEYINASDSSKKMMEDSVNMFPQLIKAESNRRYQAGLISRMIRGSIRKNFSNKANSVFRHLTIFSLPHVYSSWLIAKRLQYLIENTFAIYSTELKNYSDDIANNLGIIYGRTAIRKLVPEEFFKFITSDMKLHLSEGTIDFKIDPNSVASISNGRESTILYGQDAWAHKFAESFEKFKLDYNAMNPGNEFLNSVEIVTDGRGSKTLKITSDKTSNPELILKIKEGFKELLKEDTLTEGEISINPSKVALDLFKYSAISQGMFYSRTGFSLVFPVAFSEAYSSKLEEHLSRVFEKDSLGSADAIKTKYNLDRLKDSFTLQFMRNNPNTLPYRKDFPITIGRYDSRRGDLKRVYSGSIDDVFFDLSYNSTENPPKYISDFSKNCYVYIDTVGGKDLYRKITYKHNISLHEFPTGYSEGKLLSIDKLRDKSLNGHFIPKSMLEGNTIKYPFNYKLLEEGSKVYIHDVGSSSPTMLRVGTVTSIGKSELGYNYNIKFDNSISLLVSEDAKEKISLSALFTEVKSKATVFQDTTLPTIGDTNSDINIEFARGSEHVLNFIGNLPAGKYRIPSNLFNSFYKIDADSAVIAAKLLKSKTGNFFDVLGVQKPKDLDNVSGEISVDITESEDGFYEIKRNKVNRASFKTIEEHRFYFVGVQENTPVYAYIRGIDKDKADIDLVTADIVGYFSEAVVSPEELTEQLKKC